MKTYPKMQDSGVEWIGKIPEHWNIKRLKFTTKFDLSTVDRHDDDEFRVSICHYPQVYKNEKITDLTELSSGTCTKKEIEKFRLKKDDVLITKDSETPDDIGVPAYVVDDLENTVCGYHVAQLTTNKKELLGSFLFRFIQSDIVNAYFETESNGVTRFGLGKDSIANLNIVIPSITEQNSISYFIDKAISKVDLEISKNRKLIELIKEKRQSTINHVITKGLDPIVPMKDSEMEWVGKIPKHWRNIPLRHSLEDGKVGIKIGPFGSSLKLNLMAESGYKVYGQENVIESNFEVGHRFIGEQKFSEMKGYELLTGDVIVTMMGTTGLSKVIPPNIKHGIMDSHLVRVRVNKEICNNYFLAFLINSASYVKTQMKLASKGSIMEGLNSSILKSIKLFLPKIDEQKQILNYLDNQTSKIDLVISKAEYQIEKLQEFRQSLISSATTGKIDVRQEIVA